MRDNIFPAIMAISLLAFTGCRKLCNDFVQHPELPPASCRIERISFDVPMGHGEIESVQSVFSYNEYNNPVLILLDISDSPEPVDKAFRYDTENRLKVYLRYFRYGGRGTIFWHKYVYVNSMKVVDSVFVYASGDYLTNDRPDEYARVEVRELTLDIRGRVIKEISRIETDSPVEKTFHYDLNGNLIKPGVNYSNKPNIRQTNKIWQFIDRDYSVNQPLGEVESFTIHNLPYTFRDLVLSQSNVLDITPGAVVTYNCENNVTGAGVTKMY